MKNEQSLGKRGEEIAANRLRALGIEMVEKIATPVLVNVDPKSHRPYIVAWGEKVSGDHRGILPGGRSVLVETKTIIGRNLQWSDLREHQPDRLTEHDGFGGLSLLVWVSEFGVFVMRWPIAGFGPRKSIGAAEAAELDLAAVNL